MSDGSLKKIWGYDGDQWQKLGLLFGYNDVYSEAYGMEAYMDGYVYLFGGEVPAGYIYVITHMTGYNDTRAPISISFGLFNLTTMVMCTTFNEPAAHQRVGGQTHIILKKGYSAVMEVNGCITNDMLFIDIHGYKMKIS